MGGGENDCDRKKENKKKQEEEEEEEANFWNVHDQKKKQKNYNIQSTSLHTVHANALRFEVLKKEATVLLLIRC